MTGILALDVFIALAAVASGTAVLIKVFLAFKRFGDIMDDWQGEADRPGVKGRPGVMLRLKAIEEQVSPNHGSSMRDAVDGVGRKVDAMVVGMTSFQEQFDEHIRREDEGPHHQNGSAPS